MRLQAQPRSQKATQYQMKHWARLEQAPTKTRMDLALAAEIAPPAQQGFYAQFLAFDPPRN